MDRDTLSCMRGIRGGNESDHGGLTGTGNPVLAPTEDVGASVGIASSDLTSCCIPSEGSTLGEEFYCVYNRAGANPGRNFRGEPCPAWPDLPVDVRHKWEAVGDLASDLAKEAVRLHLQPRVPPPQGEEGRP